MIGIRTHAATAVKFLVGVAAVGATVVGPIQSASAISQGDAEAQLSGAGITWSSSGGCTDPNNSTCTSFEGIRQETVSGIITYKGASGCAVNITGGTETGHADGTYSHANGYKLDISVSTCNDNFITSNFTSIGPRSGDNAPQYQSAAGNIYANEGSHWDILYYNCGGC